MAVREYETWLLHARPPDELVRHGILEVERRRGAKEALTRLVPEYGPATHQMQLTRAMDLEQVRARSDSFDKLVRVLAALFGVTAPPRPLF